MFIMVDGIDGSGKSTAINTWKDWLKTEGNAVFDLKKHLQETGKYPELEEMRSYDFIFSAEPTYAGVGKMIREELIKNGTTYPTQAIAHAYSLDRLILYTKLLIPLLKDGRCVIQDRGVTTSLAYQSIGNNGLAMEKIAKLPGNNLAIKYRPDHIVLVKITPEEAANRISGRFDKKDDVIFEHLSFLKKSSNNFFSAKFKKIFSCRGTVFHHLNGDEKIDIMKTRSIALLKQLLNK